MYLSALLRGKALECYNRLGAADARNYIKLRSALLHKFGKTEEGYRKQFISCKRDSDETAAQFIVRLLGYFDRWLELAKVDETFEALRTFIARDRFLDSSEEKLALYLRERKFATLDELVTAADNYLEAHRSSAVSGPTKDKSKSYNAPQQQNIKPAASVDKQTSAHTPDTNKRTNDDRVCYNCGGFGHISRNCPSRRKDKDVNKAAACVVVPRDSVVDECRDAGSNLHLVGSLTMVETFPCLVDKLIIANGSVNGKPVKCMRDTGSTVGIIRASLVEPEALLGVRRTYMLVDGTLRESETAVVQLECPFFSGAFECLVVNSPPCDVVVGNVAGATGCEPCDVAYIHGESRSANCILRAFFAVFPDFITAHAQKHH